MSIIRQTPNVFPKPPPESKKARKRLARQSEKKASWSNLYYAGLSFLCKMDPICRRCRKVRATEGHHPLGQIGALILIFFPFCRACHDEIHGNPNRGREEGWLF